MYQHASLVVSVNIAYLLNATSHMTLTSPCFTTLDAESCLKTVGPSQILSCKQGSSDRLSLSLKRDLAGRPLGLGSTQ